MSKNLYQKAGNRCLVCTGCGRCPGVTPGISVVMEQMPLVPPQERRRAIEQRLALERQNVRTQCGCPERKNENGDIGAFRAVFADIGTTTIAMQLLGEDGNVEDSFAKVNPQTAYGADVLSRIRAARDREAAEEMSRMVREVLEQGFGRFQKRLSQGESLFAVIAANTTMVYLLMGYDAEELGQAPFTVSHRESIRTRIGQVPCVIFPALSAFVGGDIVAGIHACGMKDADRPILLIDLGTNGEMVLGNRERLLACATAAGPAFEGGVNRGVWGADMIRLLAELKKAGLLDDTGLLAEPYFESGVRAGNVLVTQESVRAVQLAKGAIRAGIDILTETYGITYEEIDRVILAGGFGYYLNPQAAVQIGLLPQELAARSFTGGNTALAGGFMWGGGIDWAEPEIINLAQVPGFEEKYINSLNLCQ